MDRARALNAAACAAFALGEIAGCPSARDGHRASAPRAIPEAPPAIEARESSMPSPELPRGGREIFPRYRLVGFCGTPNGSTMGRLMGKLAPQAKAIDAYASQYTRGRESLPVFELIAVVALGKPGPDGKYRRRVPDAVADEYLAAARASHGLLLLNIQPGQSDFLTEIAHYEKYLREPDVGVALDPEWAMTPGERPGSTFGQVTAATLNEVGEYLSSLVQNGNLPEKPLIFHQVNEWVLKDEPDIAPHAGVVLIKSVDGRGQKASKIKTYNALMKTAPASVHAGFKLFFDEDTENGHHLMTPESVLLLSPQIGRAHV